MLKMGLLINTRKYNLSYNSQLTANLMKPLCLFNPTAFIILTTLFLLNTGLIAQNDVVVMANGDIKQGKVTAMEDENIKFVYAGEDLEYTLKKAEISKIQFASGREQTFEGAEAIASGAPAGSGAVGTSTPTERKGKLAVLPVEVVTNDPGINPETMGTQIQHEAVNSFKDHSPGITVQDPRTTTSILLQNNLDPAQLALVAPGDVAAILGVEYVAYSVVNIENKGAMTTGSNVTTYKEKESNTRSDDRKDNRVKGSEVTTASSSTTIEYDCKVELSIYNDQGTSVFSESRDAFGLSQDSYNNGLNYMIRRTPFGDKHK